MKIDFKIVLFAIGATFFGLSQNIPDFPGDTEVYVSWVLNGGIYGIGAVLGIDLAQSLRVTKQEEEPPVTPTAP